jgi:hypothetical protein
MVTSLGKRLLTLNNYHLGQKLDRIRKCRHHPHYLPSIRAYHDTSGVIVSFTYVKPLEHGATGVGFLAKILEASPTSIVVKFVECYVVAAHKLLEKTEAAPQLLYYGKTDISGGKYYMAYIGVTILTLIIVLQNIFRFTCFHPSRSISTTHSRRPIQKANDLGLFLTGLAARKGCQNVWYTLLFRGTLFRE